MIKQKRYAPIIDKLRGAGLRPTRQRIALAHLMFDGDDRHFSAEALHTEAAGANVNVSLATVYNTLHQFTEAGFLREIMVSTGRSYFDTNVSDHHHFFYESDGALEDIAQEDVVLAHLPNPPDGQKIKRVDVIIRVDED